jgi:phage-related holin
MMIFFIISDTIFGVYTSIKLGGISAYKSHKLFNVVIKSFFYLVTIIMAFCIDTFIFNKSLFGFGYLCTKTMTMLWIYIEIKLDESSIKLVINHFGYLLKKWLKS